MVFTGLLVVAAGLGSSGGGGNEPSTLLPPPAESAVSGRIVERLPTRSLVVAFTFDAGGNDAGAAKILAALRTARVPATFFLTGRWALRFPRRTRTIAVRHTIGNHTYSHPDLTRLPLTAVRREVVRGEQTVRSVTGRPLARLFRFPFGAYDPSRLRLVNRLGYTAIGWTVDTLGWKGTSGGQSGRSVVARVLGALRPGEVVLMHVGAHPRDRSTLDADALPTLIRAIRARGYRFVAISSYV